MISGCLEAELWLSSRFKIAGGRGVATAVPESLQTASLMLLPGTATDLQLREAKGDVRKETLTVHRDAETETLAYVVCGTQLVS